MISIESIVKVNRLMKKMWQNFNTIFSILFVNWKDFAIVWQNTSCKVCHPAVACLRH